MKFKILSLLLLAQPAIAGGPVDTLQDAIIGGQAVPGSSRFARLTVEIISIYGENGADGVALCSGTLIGKDTVISAAHCVQSEETGDSPTKVGILLNPTLNAAAPKAIKVTNYVVHPDYTRVNDGMVNRPIHDLSILHL